MTPRRLSLPRPRLPRLDAPDWFAVVGLIGLFIGCAMVSWALAFVVPSLLLIAYAYLAARHEEPGP